MKGFRINGSFKDIRNDQKFSIEVAAEDADAAREKTLSVLGSKHKLKRRDIKIDEITELKPEEITNLVVEHQVSA
jgi:large subunit ribosomal protein LX